MIVDDNSYRYVPYNSIFSWYTLVWSANHEVSLFFPYIVLCRYFRRSCTLQFTKLAREVLKKVSLYLVCNWNIACLHGMSNVPAGIANKTKSPIGSKLLRFWFFRPLKDITTLQQRLDTIEYLLQPKHADRLSSFQDYLKHIRHIPVSLTIL